MNELSRYINLVISVTLRLCFLFNISQAEHIGCGELLDLPRMEPKDPGTGPYSIGTRIHYACSNGYRKVDGTTEAVCSQHSTDKDPEWSVPTLSCTGVSCGDPGEAPHSTRKGTIYTFPNNVTYKCDEGYAMADRRPSLFCQPNGQWTANLPQCEVISCQDLPSIPNGSVTYDPDRNYRSVATYSCNDGYKLNGGDKRQCTSNGSWTGFEPYCEAVRCSPHYFLPNGRIVHNANVTLVDTLVIFVCDSPENNRWTLKCLKSGVWSGSPPVCSPPVTEASTTRFSTTKTTSSKETSTEKSVGPSIPCEDPGVIENGFLVDKIAFPTNKSVTFGCNDGFVNKGSSILTCLHNGKWSPETLPKCQKGLSIEIIVGIVVGVAVFIILVVVGVVLYLKKKNNRFGNNPGIKNKAQPFDAKHVDEIRYLDRDKKPIPVTSL